MEKECSYTLCQLKETFLSPPTLGHPKNQLPFPCEKEGNALRSLLRNMEISTNSGYYSQQLDSTVKELPPCMRANSATSSPCQIHRRDSHRLCPHHLSSSCSRNLIKFPSMQHLSVSHLTYLLGNPVANFSPYYTLTVAILTLQLSFLCLLTKHLMTVSCE